MGAVRSRFARPRPSLVAVAMLAVLATPLGEPRLRDAPVVWYADDRRDIPQPEERDPNLVWDGAQETFFRPLGRLTHPGRLVRRIGTLFGGDHVPPAANVNTLDEAVNSSWFTNRIGLFPLTAEEAARGPGTGAGPDTSGLWTVVSAKTEGVTPGFNIQDASGQVHVIKFDLPGLLGTTTAAGVIANRVLHAAGYNVPEDVVVTFRRDDVRVGEDVTFQPVDGPERRMTEADLDAILDKADRLPDGSWLAVSSRFLSGVPIGPFGWQGRRKDDPNDGVRHENRRELRGLRIFAAWLCHFDTKQHNTLDMYVEEGGRRYVRHYLLDFASTLGAGASGIFPTRCFEYTFDFPAIIGRALSLGLHQDAWRRARRPEGLEEIGYFESQLFDPLEFKPLQPNAAFANLTDRDGYWAAKIISAFTDEHLKAIVAQGRYRNPEAAEYMARILAERRDKIARAFFDRIPPLDFFTVAGSVVRFRDLGAEPGLYPGTRARYRVRVVPVTETRQAGAGSAWIEVSLPVLNLETPSVASVLQGADDSRFQFVAFEVQVHRGQNWSSSVTAYLSRSTWRVVAVRR